MSKEEEQKYKKNHPDITGMSSGKKDKDEEEMLNDISGKGGSEGGGDPFDEIDEKPKKQPKKSPAKSKQPKDKVALQTDSQDEDSDLNDYINSKEKEDSLVSTEESDKKEAKKSKKAALTQHNAAEEDKEDTTPIKIEDLDKPDNKTENSYQSTA